MRIGHNAFGYRFVFHSFENDVLTATMNWTTEVQPADGGAPLEGVSRFVRTNTAVPGKGPWGKWGARQDSNL